MTEAQSFTQGWGGTAQKGPRKTQPNLDDLDASAQRWSKRSSATRSSASSAAESPTNLTDGPIFTTIVMTGICINALQMGLELQLMDEPWTTIWLWMEQFFTAFFLFEFVIKLMVIGPIKFFSDKMNLLDFVVVVSAVVDNWILKIFLDDGEGSLGFLGILRLVRLSRILKLLRAKRELMLLLEGIISSIRSMFWLSILLVILVYTSGICFVLFIGESDVYDDDDDFDNKHYFGDLVSACVTGLNLALLADWEDVIRPIARKQPWFALGLCAYVAISCFGIMNAIIGVIVTRTADASEAAKDEELYEYRMNQMDVVENIKEIVYSIDTSGDGTVSKDEINAAEENEELKSILEEVELPYAFSLEDLHTMLDKDGDGELSAAEFFIGMRRLVFSNEFQRECVLVHAVQQVKRKIYELRQEMEAGFQDISDKLSDKLVAKIDSKFEAILQVVASNRPQEPPQGCSKESNEKHIAPTNEESFTSSKGRMPDARQPLDGSLSGRSISNRKDVVQSNLRQNEIVPSNQAAIINADQYTKPVIKPLAKSANSDSLIIKTHHVPSQIALPANMLLGRTDFKDVEGSVVSDCFPEISIVQLPGSPERPQHPKTPPPTFPMNEKEEGVEGNSQMREISSPVESPLRNAGQGDQQAMQLEQEHSVPPSPEKQTHPATDTPEKLTTATSRRTPVRKKGAFGGFGGPANESLL